MTELSYLHITTKNGGVKTLVGQGEEFLKQVGEILVFSGGNQFPKAEIQDDNDNTIGYLNMSSVTWEKERPKDWYR